MYDSLAQLAEFICHRIPERSFHWNETQFLVCARCSGIYLSIVLTIVSVPLHNVSFNGAIKTIVISALLNGISTLMPFNNEMRLIAGALIGTSLTLLFLSSLRNLFDRRKIDASN